MTPERLERAYLESVWRAGRLWIFDGKPRWLLPAHVSISGEDFAVDDDTVAEICLACSYTYPDGQPLRPVRAPCAVVCGHARLRDQVGALAVECPACDTGLVEYGCRCPTGDPRPVLIALLHEVERLARLVPPQPRRRVDPRHTTG